MSVLKTFRKTTADLKRYTIDYTDWLDTGESVLTAAYAVDHTTAHPLTITGQTIATDGKSISYFVGAGDAGETYRVVVTITTSGGQTKADAVSHIVSAP